MFLEKICRFNSISFQGQEGWIIGKPAILLHTSDGGENWERIPLSIRLPGNPVIHPTCVMTLQEFHLFIPVPVYSFQKEISKEICCDDSTAT